MNYFSTLSVIDDIGNFLGMIVKPFELLFKFIQIIADAITGIVIIFTNLSGIVMSILYLLPSPFFETLIVYWGVFISIMTFKLVKGII